MRRTRGVVLAWVAFLALTGAGATALGAQGTKL